MKRKAKKPLHKKASVKKAKHKIPAEALSYLYDKAVEIGVWLALDWIYPCHEKKVLESMKNDILKVQK